MKRTVLVFGILSGLIATAMMWLTLPFMHRGVINFKNGEVIGYTSIFLSLLLVFFGIRSYRENHGGTISFGRAFSVGILITLISCCFYVASWLVIYYNFMPDFMDRYAAHVIQTMTQAGASDAALKAKQIELTSMKEMLKNPLINAAMTFIEPFPVGLVMTLVSAGILRRRAPGAPKTAAAAIA